MRDYPVRLAYMVGMPDLPSIAKAGHNCWRVVHADRLAFMVDGETYFRALKSALRQARRSVLIIGWEFDSRTRLERDGETAGPDTIGELLRHLVRDNDGLEIHLLIWDSALIYSLDREFIPVVKHDRLSHPRLHFRLDDSHPIGASHHQKIVVIDDRLAFLGGLDITGRRWDSSAHLPDDPRRSDPGFPHYDPFHDVQVAMTGEAAEALGQLARARWYGATGRRLPPIRPGLSAPWPDDLACDLEDVTVSLARTAPAWEGHPGIREVEQLFLDMIGAARHTIYVENQYFASRTVAQVLEDRLKQANCPEIAVTTSGFSAGLLERTAMGASRNRLQARLHQADRHGRLQLYAPSAGSRLIKVHAKVMVVDDSLLRVGSANLNNRSMGLDTECDVLIESAGNPRISEVIAGFRNRLLAEHLGQSAQGVAETLAECGLHGTIARLNGASRHLNPISPPTVDKEYLPEIELLDPDAPVETMLMAAAQPARPPKLPLAARFTTGLALLLLLTTAAMLCQWLPRPPFERLVSAIETLRGEPLLPALVVGVFLLAGLTGMPVFLLVAATGSLFGGWLGGCYAFLGILASAAFSFGIGRHLGAAVLRRLTGRRASRISRALSRHGLIAMAMLRIVPVASFTTVNLMAGAAGLRLGEFLTASAVGMLPMVVGFSIFGDRFAAVLRQPDEINTALLSALTLVLSLTSTAVVMRMLRAASATVEGSGHE